MQCVSFRFMWSKNVLHIYLSKSIVEIMTWFLASPSCSSTVADFWHFVHLEHFNGNWEELYWDIWFGGFQLFFFFYHVPRLAMVIYVNKTSFMQLNYKLKTVTLFVPVFSIMACSFSLKSAGHNSENLKTMIWSFAVLCGIRAIHYSTCLYYVQYQLLCW